MEQVNISSPWYSYVHKLEAFFGEDPTIKIDFNEEDFEIKIFVEGAAKADALAKLLPEEKVFGTIIVKITVVPANEEPSRISLIRDAFSGNPALSYIAYNDMFSSTINYVVFENKVVQYFNDNLHDANGIESTLYQELAKEIFGEDEGIYYCTELGM